MKNFMIALILALLIQGVGWEMIGIIPNNFLEENKDPAIKQYIIEEWINNIKTIHPHCRGAYIRFVKSDIDDSLSEIYANCYKWEI